MSAHDAQFGLVYIAAVPTTMVSVISPPSFAMADGLWGGLCHTLAMMPAELVQQPTGQVTDQARLGPRLLSAPDSARIASPAVLKTRPRCSSTSFSNTSLWPRKCLQRALFVLCHQPAVGRDVRGKDRRQFAFEAIGRGAAFGHSMPAINSGHGSYRGVREESRSG